jgi:TolB-like protein
MGEGADKTSESESQRPGAAAPLFISYASQDVEVANAICQSLESQGIPCWMAPRDVKPGAQYADAIVRAINDAKAIVLVMSASAVASAHVGREVERAASKRKPIIAFRVDAAPLSAPLEYFLSQSQWIDVPALGMKAASAKLAEAVGQESPSSTQAIPVAKHGVGMTRRVAIAVAVVVALGVVVGSGFYLWKSNHGAAQAPAVAAITDKSIAVLPFVDMSEKKDQEYFGDGIAEELLDRLAQVPGLRVVGRASSFQFKGKSADPASVGAVLGVAYLLEGSVRREADHLRVIAQLVETKTGSQRWSDRFDSDVVDVLQVQDTIAAELARALQVAVEADTVPRSSVKSPQVVDAYLRGLQFRNRESRESLEAAVANFQQALTLDPTFAPAADGLAEIYVHIGAQGWLPTQIAFERAREAAVLAQRLDPKSAAPHVYMAQIHVYYDWDWTGADRELQQAFVLGPRDSSGTLIASQLASARGHQVESRELGIGALTLDPLNARAYMILGWKVYLHTGQFAEAEQAIRRGLQIAPKWGSGQYALGETLLLQGNYQAALTEFTKETLDDGQLEGSALAYYAAGRKTESDAQLAEAIRRNGMSWPSGIARVYAFRGEKDKAFEWLNRALSDRDGDLYIIKGDPLFKNLEGDPRFKSFLRKMNLPE